MYNLVAYPSPVAQPQVLSPTSTADSDMPAARAKALAPTEQAEGAPPPNTNPAPGAVAVSPLRPDPSPLWIS
eukprot:12301168-Prorocentrum_lima.AAC.1